MKIVLRCVLTHTFLGTKLFIRNHTYHICSNIQIYRFWCCVVCSVAKGLGSILVCLGGISWGGQLGLKLEYYKNSVPDTCPRVPGKHFLQVQLTGTHGHPHQHALCCRIKFHVIQVKLNAAYASNLLAHHVDMSRLLPYHDPTLKKLLIDVLPNISTIHSPEPSHKRLRTPFFHPEGRVRHVACTI